MTKKTKINKNKKREVNEDEGSNLVNNKKRKVSSNKKNVKTDEVNNNKINEEIDKLTNEANKEHDNLPVSIENDKKQTEMEINNEESNVNDSVKDKNKKEENINKEKGEDKKESKNKEENKKAKSIDNLPDIEDNNKDNNDNTNKTNNKNNNGKKEEVNSKTDASSLSKTKPLRKSKRLLDKQIEIISISTSKKDDTKKVPTTVKKKRMNADQDLITHQTLENAENLGSKNPLEIIRKVIGNSDEDVELVVGAQLPVLVQPDINRMRYELGEIIAIKTKSEIVKENGEINSIEMDDKKKSKKIKGKKGKTTKEDGDKKATDQKIESTNNKNENNENSMKIDDKDIEMSEANQENENEMKNGKNEESIAKGNDNEEEKMYYIHFINQDKRLDNWRREEDLWTNKKYPEISNDASETTEQTTPYLYIPDDKSKLTRNMKRKYGIINESLQSLSEIDPKLAALEKEREEITKVKNIEKVQFGNYLLNSWYFSPYPNEYKNRSKLYICDHCMKYMIYESTLIKHRKECPMLHPPGTLVYEKDNLRVYEIDGKKEKLYCQNFCLLSKLFLDHKTVYYDIEPFLFYVLTEKKEENGKEVDYVMGYFSKEKKSFDDYNLACILVLPPYQRKGYGHFLIEFSYELSKRENKIGSPEKPLSDLGLVGYRTYWQSVLLRIIKNNPKMNFTLRELSLLTSIRHEDIVSTLGSMNMLKYWKGEHSLCVTPKMVEDFLSEHQNIKMEPMVDASLIHDTFISEPIVNKKNKYIDLTKP